jgi:glycerophosphoryl diester phosphodiesterase
MPDFHFPKIIAHRGASARAPENTLSAFQLAWECDADGIEGDFRLTRDGRIVCMHDATTDRTGNESLTVSDCNLDQLRHVDLGAWKGDEWFGEHIATLEDVLAILPVNKQFFLEVKCGPEIVPVLKQILDKTPCSTDCLSVIAFDPRVIAAMKTELPHIQANWLAKFDFDLETATWRPTGEEVLAVLEELKTNGVGLQANLAAIDEAFVAPLHKNDVALHVWTVDDEVSAARFVELGFQSITTNRPDIMRLKLAGRLNT